METLGSSCGPGHPLDSPCFLAVPLPPAFLLPGSHGSGFWELPKRQAGLPKPVTASIGTGVAPPNVTWLFCWLSLHSNGRSARDPFITWFSNLVTPLAVHCETFRPRRRGGGFAWGQGQRGHEPSHVTLNAAMSSLEKASSEAQNGGLVFFPCHVFHCSTFAGHLGVWLSQAEDSLAKQVEGHSPGAV